jgi:cbb3-type cytochrome oxidase subunit 3
MWIVGTITAKVSSLVEMLAVLLFVFVFLAVVSALWDEQREFFGQARETNLQGEDK